MEKKLATFAEIQQKILSEVQGNPSDCDLIRRASHLADICLSRSAQLPVNTVEKILFLKTQIYEIHLRSETGCQDLQHLLEVYQHIESIG